MMPMRKMASRVSSPTNKPCTDGSSSRILIIGLQNHRTRQLNLVSNQRHPRLPRPSLLQNADSHLQNRRKQQPTKVRSLFASSKQLHHPLAPTNSQSIRSTIKTKCSLRLLRLSRIRSPFLRMALSSAIPRPNLHTTPNHQLDQQSAHERREDYRKTALEPVFTGLGQRGYH